MIEREIAERIRAEKIRLRFDRVVRRFNNNLKAALAAIVPEGQSVICLGTQSRIRPRPYLAIAGAPARAELTQHYAAEKHEVLSSGANRYATFSTHMRR